jgi:hypothetical protein
MDYRHTYAQMPDHVLQELSRNRNDLLDDAVSALTDELARRQLPETRAADPRSKAYETLGGVVVTQWSIRIPSCCVRCVNSGANMRVKIISLDAETKYRIVYTERVSRTYEFLFCRDCATELGRIGQFGNGVWFQNLPTTKYDLFFFANHDYAKLFLKANE